jgi:PAS domain S-box-containing protein
MDQSTLLEEALAERGNVVALLVRPRDGENAVIQTCNAPFARLIGWPEDRVAGLRLAELRPLVERPEDWTTLVAAVHSLRALTLELRLRVKGREVWLGFSLTFRADAAGGDGYGILIGRDITAVRESNLRETESQRLLAAVFLRIGAAVAIIDGDSTILMANPACHQLLEYRPGEMTGKNVEDLIAPESTEMVHAARTRQLAGAGDYVMRMAVLAKGGARVPVTLFSTLLRDARDRQLRVATVIPDSAPRDPVQPEAQQQPGQLLAVSLAALKAAYGNEWRLVGDRAMRRAEQILKRHLDVADVLQRQNDHGYLIWFAAADDAHNAAVLAAATQEIRQRLLADADDVVLDRADPISIGAEAIPVEPLRWPATLRAELDDDFEDNEGSPPERDPDSLMRYLRAGAVANVEPVAGRDGVERPIVLVDFEPRVRGCLYNLAPSLWREPAVGVGFDVMRIDLAVQALGELQEATKVLVPVSWASVADPDCRSVLGRRLAQIGRGSRARVMLAVAGVPGLVDKQRWSDAVGPLRHYLGDVGLLLTHREGELAAMQSAITSEWPLSLLVVDRTEGPPVVIEGYRSLIAAARRREIAVLVRTTAQNDIGAWRQLGATMFATAA